MKKTWIVTLACLGLTSAAAGLMPLKASSHREAPLISADPLADNTDLYAFVSPATPDKVTIIANFIPLEAPYGGPNFYKFDDNVLYEIKIDNNGDAKRERTKFLPDNIYDAIRLFKGSKLMSDLLGAEVHQRFVDLKTMQADRCPRALGSTIKTSEVQFHHEVTNQYLWSQF